MTAAQERLVVLLADDDENDVFLIRRAFKRMSAMAQLLVVPHGEAAVSYLQGQGDYADRSKWPLPRMLILDQWMPRLSGLDVLCWVRLEPRFDGLPVVILTGGLSPSQSRLMTQLRAAVCSKSIDSKEMESGIEQAMRASLELAWETSIRGKSAWFVPPTPPVMGLSNRNECEQVHR